MISNLLMTIHNVEFQPKKNRFLSKLKEHVKAIKNTKELLINTNSYSNIYKVDRGTYCKHLKKTSPKHIRNQRETKSAKLTLTQTRLPAC